jgi:hypothetical protein
VALGQQCDGLGPTVVSAALVLRAGVAKADDEMIGRQRLLLAAAL